MDVTHNDILEMSDLPELVIDEILKNLDWKSQLNCRLVWRSWDKCIKSAIEKNQDLFLDLNDDLRINDKIIKNIVNNPDPLLPPGLILSTVNPPTISSLLEINDFLKFRILRVDFWTQQDIIKDDDFFSILQMLSPTLETLDCFNLSIAQMTTDRYNKVSGTLSLPNLRKLCLPLHDKINASHCWQRLVISAAPNLTIVEENLRHFNEHINVVEILNETQKLSQLKVLSLVDLKAEQLEAILQTDHLKLEEFKTKFIPYDSLMEKLQEFLHKQKDSLKKLYLHSESLNPFPPLLLPTMNNLTDFSFYSGFLFESLKFSEYFPKLKELVVLRSEATDRWLEVLETPYNLANPCSTLRRLRLDMATRPKIFEELSDTIAKIFPGVTSLRLRWPTERFLTEIWRNWPNLRDLFIESVGVGDNTRRPCRLDKVLFGITEEWKDSLDKKEDMWTKSGTFANRLFRWAKVTPPEPAEPTILNLKFLEKLTIRDCGSKMSNLSIHLGFAKMKNLRILEFNRKEMYRITNEDIAFLQDAIPGLIVREYDLPYK